MNAIEVINRIECLEELLKYVEWTYNHACILKQKSSYENEFLIRALQTTKTQTEKEIYDLKLVLENTEINC